MYIMNAISQQKGKTTHSRNNMGEYYVEWKKTQRVHMVGINLSEIQEKAEL